MKPSATQLKQLRALCVKINAAIDAGQTGPALSKLRQLDARFPNQLPVQSMLGKVNTRMGRHAEAIEAYRSAAELSPKDPDLRFLLALALQKGGRYEESLVEYERTLYLAPDHFYALRHKVSALIDLDRTDAALKAWDALRASTRDKALTASQRLALANSGARLAPKAMDAGEAIAELEAALKAAGTDSAEQTLRVAGYWQLGRLYSTLKEYDKAFDAWTACKEIGKQGWDPDEHSRRIDRLIECWTGDGGIPFSDIDGSRLIFIVGMMRSGTSLTEQMVARAPGVTPGGEMNAISRQVSMIERSEMPHGRAYASTRRLYTRQTIQKMAGGAMEMYARVAAEGRVTDKQPYNYAHVPLIAHIFPGCKIVRCVRDPMDCCLSNYTQAFARPHMQTHDQYWLGRYERDYERLMTAWKSLEEVEMIDLHYERLVSDPEAESRRVFGFLGLEWSPRVLRFHESDRTISTASRDQVRRPMYTSSVQKHKLYEHRLGELKRGLGLGASADP